MSGDATRPCNALFCVLVRHDGDDHVDATGHTWAEPTPATEVVARAYSWNDTSTLAAGER